MKMDKNLHIPQGYRQTEVGVIPDDWEVVKLNEKAFIQRGKFSPRPRNNPKYYHGKYPFVQTSDVVNSKGKITSYSQTLNDKGLAVSKLFPYGTILMTVAANIGFTGILARDMACPDSLVGIQCKKSLYNKFLNFYFIYNQKKIDYLAEEAAQKNINLSILNNLRIPMPPKQEQQKIADILTTWDNAINQQTTLIEKKQQLKKGLMQQLLTAKTRFSEFSDDWEIVKLCDIVKINKGKQLNKAGLSKIDKYPVVNGGISPSGYTNKWNVEKDTITISEGGNSCGYVNFITSKFWSGGHCYSVTKINPNTVNKFLFQFLKFKERLIMNLRVGSGLPNIQKKDINLFKIKLPPTKEQQKIAQVLTLADDEITKLQTELVLLKTQKKGLMQQLLTGKIRIKI